MCTEPMICLQKLNTLKLYPSLMYQLPTRSTGCGDLVSTSMNEELKSAINLKKYRQAKHILHRNHSETDSYG